MSQDSENKIVIDGQEINVSDLSEDAKMQIESLKFVGVRIQQLENELAVADTARIGYKNALENEVARSETD